MGRQQFRSLTESVGETASRSGELYSAGQDINLDAGEFETGQAYNNSTESTQFWEVATLATDKGAGIAVDVKLTVRADGYPAVDFCGNPENFPLEINPSVPIPPQGEIAYSAENNTSEFQDVQLYVVVRR